jgi:hypothetical protein
MDKEAILRWAQRRMAGADDGPLEPGYRYHHGLRVAAIAVGLAERLSLVSDSEVLYVSGVLHDVGKSGYEGESPHGPRGEEIIRAEAASWFTPDELERVGRMVARHYARPRSRWYEGQEQKPVWPDEVLILQDADILDHFGCNHVWQAFLWAKHLRQSPQDTLAYYWRNPRELEWRTEARRALNFDLSRSEFDIRLARSDAFCREFAMEQAGTLA